MFHRQQEQISTKSSKDSPKGTQYTTKSANEAHSVVQRAKADPSSLNADEVNTLQGTIGNRAAHRLLAGQSATQVQAKLTIGEPRDKYEQEADAVAARVVEQIHAPVTAQSSQGQSVQREAEEETEEVRAKPEISALQRMDEPNEEEIQGKYIQKAGEAKAGGEASTDLDSAINSARGGGQPLDAGLQESMGQAMGADFSGVRVHTDTQADELNQSIQAKAFTTGQDVFFRQGAYEPGSRGGQELIAHELTHVVQQKGNGVQSASMEVIQAGFLDWVPTWFGGNWGKKRMLGGQQAAPPLPKAGTSQLQAQMPEEELAARNLASFEVVNLIDHASTGTGHQAAMFALINNLASLKYQGQVHLTYYRWKTRFWCGKFQVNLSDATLAFEKHTQPWEVTYKNLKITCHPIGDYPDKYTKLKGDFNDRVNNQKTEAIFWQKIWWDNAEGCELGELKNPSQWSSKKFLKGDGKFEELRKEISKFQEEWSLGEMSGSFGNALTDPPVVNQPINSDQPKTLTMYAALDNPELNKDLVDVIRRMTGEAQPFTIILQPFLWANQQHANPQVLQGEKMKTDIQKTISARGQVPVYPQQITNPDNIDNFVELKDPKATNKEVVKSILNKAKSNTINLISAYYTQASASDVPYEKLIKVLVAAMQHKDIANNKPTVIALLGNEAITAHTEAFNALDQTQKAKVSLGDNPAIYNDLHALQEKIVLEHIGRTMAMSLFERLSLFFVTEGANTWQETLTVGTPSLSARPSGETQPWTQEMGIPTAANMVKEASMALVNLAKLDNINNLQAQPDIEKLVNFIKAVRDDKNSDVNKYFQKWSQALSNPAGNQVVAALSSLSLKSK